jgi:hypothetical protein
MSGGDAACQFILVVNICREQSLLAVNVGNALRPIILVVSAGSEQPLWATRIHGGNAFCPLIMVVNGGSVQPLSATRMIVRNALRLLCLVVNIGVEQSLWDTRSLVVHSGSQQPLRA